MVMDTDTDTDKDMDIDTDTAMVMDSQDTWDQNKRREPWTRDRPSLFDMAMHPSVITPVG